MTLFFMVYYKYFKKHWQQKAFLSYFKIYMVTPD